MNPYKFSGYDNRVDFNLTEFQKKVLDILVGTHRARLLWTGEQVWGVTIRRRGREWRVTALTRDTRRHLNLTEPAHVGIREVFL